MNGADSNKKAFKPKAIEASKAGSLRTILENRLAKKVRMKSRRTEVRLTFLRFGTKFNPKRFHFMTCRCKPLAVNLEPL